MTVYIQVLIWEVLAAATGRQREHSLYVPLAKLVTGLVDNDN
jgi:hypothetical protein